MKQFNEKTFVPDENPNWSYISQCQVLSEDFIEKFKDYVSWNHISSYQVISETFIEKFKDKVNWYYTSHFQVLSEEFIEKFQDKVEWDNISHYQVLSEEFIEQFQNKVKWDNISSSQTLSEEFIEKFKDKVKWDNISQYQVLSEDFIEKFQDKVEWDNISHYQSLSKEFIKKHNLTISEDNWLYWTKEQKLEYVKENTDYEVVSDEWIYAFKSVKRNNASVYKPGQLYEVGKTYKAHCDCNQSNADSFGLSACTRKWALGYHSKGNLFKVKVPIDKIGCIVHDGSKIRCFELEIMGQA